MRAYYRHSGVVLKRAGVTSVRLDHAGKDPGRGPHGSSAKVDDVDVVWKFTRAEAEGVSLRATHRRIGWVPETVNYAAREDPFLRYVPAAGAWPAGTADVAGLLDRLGVPLGASSREAFSALKAAEQGRPRDRRALRVEVAQGQDRGTGTAPRKGRGRGGTHLGTHARCHPRDPPMGPTYPPSG